VEPVISRISWMQKPDGLHLPRSYSGRRGPIVEVLAHRLRKRHGALSLVLIGYLNGYLVMRSWWVTVNRRNYYEGNSTYSCAYTFPVGFLIDPTSPFSLPSWLAWVRKPDTSLVGRPRALYLKGGKLSGIELSRYVVGNTGRVFPGRKAKVQNSIRIEENEQNVAHQKD
jgi:hypothetical protein